MKKMRLFGLILGVLFLTSACNFNTTNLDNATIYTTVYPVEYITEYLYGDNSTVSSIYPNGVNLDDYKLTSKQIDEYSKGDLFVYVGVGKEKEIAKSFLNKNDELLIIDASYGLNYHNDIEELWLAPNNFLMLAKNIKGSLTEYLNNTLKEEEVNKKYDELYAKVSWIDAELRNVAKEAKELDNNTLVVSSNTLKYLEGYGFTVISLEEIEASGSENALTDIKNKFKNSKYDTVIKLASEKNTKLIDELKDKNKANILTINDVITNDDTANDYIAIQNENIAQIRNLLIK